MKAKVIPYVVAIDNLGRRRQVADGATLQFALDRPLGGWDNRFLAGLDASDGRLRYASTVEAAQLGDDRRIAGSGRFVPADAICGGEAHFDARGPLRKEWRDTDSLWALATPEELERALAKVRDLDARGELDTWMYVLDAMRPSVGQITFVVAAKTSAFSSETS